MKYAIKRHDGKLFPERFSTRNEAQAELDYKLGNGASYGLAWIVEIRLMPAILTREAFDGSALGKFVNSL